MDVHPKRIATSVVRKTPSAGKITCTKERDLLTPVAAQEGRPQRPEVAGRALLGLPHQRLTSREPTALSTAVKRLQNDALRVFEGLGELQKRRRLRRQRFGGFAEVLDFAI